MPFIKQQPLKKNVRKVIQNKYKRSLKCHRLRCKNLVAVVIKHLRIPYNVSFKRYKLLLDYCVCMCVRASKCTRACVCVSLSMAIQSFRDSIWMEDVHYPTLFCCFTEISECKQWIDIWPCHIIKMPVQLESLFSHVLPKLSFTSTVEISKNIKELILTEIMNL